MENDIVVGLDIGTTKIACFIGTRTEDGKVHILGHGRTDSVGVERGVVKNIKSTADSIRKAVQMAADKANVDVDEVYVGIAGQHIRSMQNSGSIMIPAEHKLIEQEDLDRLIEDQHRIVMQPGDEIVHIFPQSFSVDNEPLGVEVEPVGVAGRSLQANFHIVTANTENLRNIKDSVNAAGYTIKGVVLEPIASSLAVLDDRDRNAGVALVDIGGGTTDIAIFHDGIIRHTSVLAFAGSVITNDIREGCKILKSQAESLKIKFGSCLPSNVSEDDIISIPGIRNQAPREISMKTLAGIIHNRTEMLIEQFNYEISASGYEKQMLAGIVLTGGGAELKHIKELTEFTTGIDTRIGTPDEHMDRPSINDETNRPMYATGVGLVIYGLDQEEKARQRYQEDVKSSFSDIFADMGDEEPAAEAAPEPEPEKEPEKEKKSKKVKKQKSERDRANWSDSIGHFFEGIFKDDLGE